MGGTLLAPGGSEGPVKLMASAQGVIHSFISWPQALGIARFSRTMSMTTQSIIVYTGSRSRLSSTMSSVREQTDLVWPHVETWR